MRTTALSVAEPASMRRVRVLVVDDSATMRQLIRLRLQSDARMMVVGDAASALEARAKITQLRPDVLTLDVEMPGGSGLELLRHIMATRPRPVIMVAAATHKGSAAALEALSLGAIDCVGKPHATRGGDLFGELPDLVAAAARAHLRPLASRRRAAPRVSSGTYRWNGRLVLIGASTGGVETLERIIERWPPDCPPTVICQHMPGAFLASFAARMNARAAPRVALAAEGTVLERGLVLIAPGGERHLVIEGAVRPRCALLGEARVNGHWPSIDVLFRSAVPVAQRCVAVILTGMGRDGAAGMRDLRRAGACCLAQDEASSVIWGMPRIAWLTGAAERLVPLDSMATEILRETSGGGAAARAV